MQYIQRARNIPLALTASLLGCAAPESTSAVAHPSTPAPASPPASPPVLLQVHDESGRPSSWPVVEVTHAGTNRNAGFLHGDASGRVEIDLPAGVYDVDVTAPQGYARHHRIEVPATTASVTLSADCELTTGRAAGDVHPGEYVWFRDVNERHYLGALVRDDGGFSACLPMGIFALEAHDDQLSPPFHFDSGSDVTFEAYSPSKIETPPPPVSSLPLEESIAPLLASEAQVIGIGEANHGSHEFLALRTRESLRLARTSGVRYIALEAGPAEVFPLDEYVHGRLARATVAVSRLGYWMWDTKDMLAALDEIRAYNLSGSPAAQVTLVGIDVQQWTGAALYLLDEAYALLTKRGQPPLRARLALRQIQWRLRMLNAPPRSAGHQRDLGMAALTETVGAFADDARVVIWAHNTHVSTDASSQYAPLGSHLRARLGKRYVAVGLLMGRGTFRAWDYETKIGVIEHTVTERNPASLEAALAPHVPSGYRFLRLADVPALHDWLAIPRRTNQNGGVMPWKNQWVLYDHLASVDIVGFVADVTPTTPMPTGVRRAPPL